MLYLATKYTYHTYTAGALHIQLHLVNRWNSSVMKKISNLLDSLATSDHPLLESLLDIFHCWSHSFISWYFFRFLSFTTTNKNIILSRPLTFLLDSIDMTSNLVKERNLKYVHIHSVIRPLNHSTDNPYINKNLDPSSTACTALDPSF